MVSYDELKARKAMRRDLIRLAVVCAVAVALVWLVTQGVSDAAIAGGVR